MMTQSHTITSDKLDVKAVQSNVKKLIQPSEWSFFGTTGTIKIAPQEIKILDITIPICQHQGLRGGQHG